MSPKIVDKEEKRRQILEAALREFARRGFSRTKMDDVARAAGIGKGTVYEYFTNKDELFFALYEHVRTTFHDTIYRNAERQETAAKALAVFIGDTISALNEWREFGTVLLDFWSEHRRARSKHLRFGDVYEFSRKKIAGFIRKGIRSGEFRNIDPKAGAASIIAVLDGLLLQRIFSPAAFSGSGDARKIVDIVLGGFLA
jgi:AcrR family transcriptional regulator